MIGARVRGLADPDVMRDSLNDHDSDVPRGVRDEHGARHSLSKSTAPFRNAIARAARLRAPAESARELAPPSLRSEGSARVEPLAKRCDSGALRRMGPRGRFSNERRPTHAFRPRETAFDRAIERTTRAFVAILVSIAMLALVTGCSRAPKRPNVLLITIDTWRADRLSANGFARITTPRLDELAASGLRFENATVPRAKTTPSIASLLTGLYPHDHGARELMQVLPSDRTLLQERLRAAGYRTAAIVGNFVLKDAFCGLASGFDSWCDELAPGSGIPPDDVPQRTARSLTDGALQALGLASTSSESSDDLGPRERFTRDEKPWFLWLHYMDPHGSYDPPDEHRVFRSTIADPITPDAGEPAASDPNAHARRWIAEYNVPASARAPDGTIDAALVRDLYDGEVHYADAQIGRLLDALRAAGELENTLVVVTSDHGESLGEQDYWFEHGRNVSEATCRVPLVVKLPSSIAKDHGAATGAREGDVSIVDVAPTILDLLALPPLVPASATQLAGVSRAALAQADDLRPHAVFMEKMERAETPHVVHQKAVRMGPWKLVRRFTLAQDVNGARTARLVGEELYDVGRDRFETQNLIDAIPTEAPIARLRAELLRFSAADVRFADLAALLQKEREELERDDPETARILEALGY